MPDFNRNHFQLFGLPESFALDEGALERAYRDIQAEIHPDRFAHAGEAEKRLSMQWASRVNEAYRTLREPFERARYLLELNGVDALDAEGNPMSQDFLMQQMEWREQLMKAKDDEDVHGMERLEADLRSAADILLHELGFLLDEKQDCPRAAEALRKYRFMERLLAEVDAAYDDMAA
jgi:molecular chaperone HscB